ncbi:MAG: MYXO-CTERM sorting domain-containing protein, partial [Myxococcota bacterium]
GAEGPDGSDGPTPPVNDAGSDAGQTDARGPNGGGSEPGEGGGGTFPGCQCQGSADPMSVLGFFGMVMVLRRRRRSASLN